LCLPALYQTFIKLVTGPQRKHRVANNSVCCGLLIGCFGPDPKENTSY
jgi:hypothetical protein